MRVILSHNPLGIIPGKSPREARQHPGFEPDVILPGPDNVRPEFLQIPKENGLFYPSSDPDRFCMGMQAFGVSNGLDRVTDHLKSLAGDHLNGCGLAEVLDIEP